MSVLLEFPLLSLFFVGLFAFLLVTAVRRGKGADANARKCARCGKPNPLTAQFCRRCGQAIGGVGH